MKKTLIPIGSDHAGFPLKSHIVEIFEKTSLKDKYELIDCGCHDSLVSVNYPDIAKKVCEIVCKEESSLGILVCGSGVGMSMAANKYSPEIRAALCHDPVIARLSKEHNNSNILCMGAWFVSNFMSEKVINEWLDSSFQGGRHQNRIDMFSSLQCKCK